MKHNHSVLINCHFAFVKAVQDGEITVAESEDHHFQAGLLYGLIDKEIVECSRSEQPCSGRNALETGVVLPV